MKKRYFIDEIKRRTDPGEVTLSSSNFCDLIRIEKENECISFQLSFHIFDSLSCELSCEEEI